MPNSLQRIAVRIPAVQQPALYICRYPAGEPRPWDRAIWVPEPLSGGARPGVVAGHMLFLPGEPRGTAWPVLDSTLDPTVPGLWVEMEGTPLTIPLLAEQQLRFEESWRAKFVFTPWALHLPFTAAAHARLGWAVLARIPRTELIGRLALLSCVFEYRGTDPSFLEQFVRVMGLPPFYRNNLLAAARGGQPILDPKSLRWILTEIAAADQAELEARATWRPDPGSEEELLARSLLSCLVGTHPPTWEHFRTALWLLGDSFHGAEQPFSTETGVLAGITALGYSTTKGSAWLPLLDRWRAIWSVPDDHRAVRRSAAPPSVVRADYGAALGIDPVAWLAGVSGIAVRWWMGLQQDAPAKDLLFPVTLEKARCVPLGATENRLSDEFIGVLRTHLVASVEQFSAEVRAEAPNYGGLGSLPQTDPVACRNHPILELPGDFVLPISLNLIAERAAVLHRWLLNTHGARQVNGPVGYMFEAYIDDVLSSKAGRSHRILSEAEIAAVVGQATRCDLALVNGTEWLFIESSLQTIARTVATGKVSGIDALCLRYHHEADQAEATAARAGDLAAAYGLPKPTATGYIVVVDNSAPHSPALMRRMHELRLGRNPRFVVSADELEGLAQLAQRGWSVPGAVRRWQAQPQEGPISVVSAELAWLMAPDARPTQEELGRWCSEMPVAKPSKVA